MPLAMAAAEPSTSSMFGILATPPGSQFFEPQPGRLSGTLSPGRNGATPTRSPTASRSRLENPLSAHRNGAVGLDEEQRRHVRDGEGVAHRVAGGVVQQGHESDAEIPAELLVAAASSCEIPTIWTAPGGLPWWRRSRNGNVYWHTGQDTLKNASSAGPFARISPSECLAPRGPATETRAPASPAGSIRFWFQKAIQLQPSAWRARVLERGRRPAANIPWQSGGRWPACAAGAIPRQPTGPFAPSVPERS